MLEPRKKVYVCYNKEAFTYDGVLADLLEESYGFAFYIGHEPAHVNDCDEFWVYGDCKEYECFYKAVELGIDIWTMA